MGCFRATNKSLPRNGWCEFCESPFTDGIINYVNSKQQLMHINSLFNSSLDLKPVKIRNVKEIRFLPFQVVHSFRDLIPQTERNLNKLSDRLSRGLKLHVVSISL